MSEVNCARISGRSKIQRFLVYKIHVMLQVSYRCMRVTVLNYWAHLVVGVFVLMLWFLVCVWVLLSFCFIFFVSTFWSRVWIQSVFWLDPAKRAGKSVQKDPSSSVSVFISCEDSRRCHYCSCSWQSALTGNLERPVALFSLQVDGRWWIEFFQ